MAQLFEPAAALKSMRKNTLSCYAAFGEVLDNSVQAEADKIFVEFNPKKIGQKARITSAAFIDNGCGMDTEILFGCLTIGSSSRLDDVEGIGKFGIGLPFASIKQCSDIKVYSKTKTTKWQSVSLNLSQLTGDDPISKPVEEEPPEKYLKKVKSNQKLKSSDGECGTIVLWNNIDQNDVPFDTLIANTAKYIGRTYRKFIWGNVEFKLNEQNVFVIDPLYYHTECTKFPDQERSDLYDPITISWPISEKDDDMVDITIQLSLLPESLRPNAGSGGSPKAKEMHIDDNNGISILRNGREVYYGMPMYEWCTPPRSNEWGESRTNPIHRWWGCEISFDARLDESFDIKNIKDQMLPSKVLSEAINDKIKGVIKSYIKEVQRVWAEFKAKQQVKIDNKKIKTKTRHSSSEDIANANIPTKKNGMATIPDIAKHLRLLIDKHGNNLSKEEEAIIRNKYQSENFSIKDVVSTNNYFMDIEHKAGGGAYILYNVTHPFHIELNGIYERLRDSEDGQLKDDSLRLIRLIDLLLVAYTRAESDFNESDQSNVGLLLGNLKTTWAQFASSLVKEIDNVKVDKDELD